MGEARNTRTDYTPSKNFPFKKWCSAKGFTTKHGYKLIEDGLLQTFVLSGRRYVSEEADTRFDATTRQSTGVQPLRHHPERLRKDRAGAGVT